MKSQEAYILHVLGCIARIEADSTGGREQVFASQTLQDAILRNLQVLCESTQRIDPALKARFSETDWPAIAGMRNVLVHDYFDVDFETVWSAVRRDIPNLKSTMIAMLAQIH